MHHEWVQHVSLFWGIPFVGILLSIAFGPLIAPKYWHKHYGKISLFWACVTATFFLIYSTPSDLFHELLIIAFHEYIPFIVLLFALFTISGGIAIKGNFVGTTRVNMSILAIGTCCASFIGTTGAAMMFIRPIINANKNRKYKIHTIVFFIFLVANIGGALSPLGDPPLFLGFLKGVSFFWPLQHMILPTLFMVICLMIIYAVIDRYYIQKEDLKDSQKSKHLDIRIEGKRNIVLLLGVITAILISGYSTQTYPLQWWGVDIKGLNIMRDVILCIFAGVSWMFTSQEIRKANEFKWFPIIEVAKLFAGIFVTLAPVIAMLKKGVNGPFKFLVERVIIDGEVQNQVFFWLTGNLSSFLDNAPTYLVFFNLAGGDAEVLMTKLATTLLAISMGAVYMGAMTYIGNAPNFMVKSIAEDQGIKMPSFFGYYLKFSLPILVPLFICVAILFI